MCSLREPVAGIIMPSLIECVLYRMCSLREPDAGIIMPGEWLPGIYQHIL
jgi:hypothetical protein